MSAVPCGCPVAHSASETSTSKFASAAASSVGRDPRGPFRSAHKCRIARTKKAFREPTLAAMSTESGSHTTHEVRVWTKYETEGLLRDGASPWQAALTATPEIKLVKGEVEEGEGGLHSGNDDNDNNSNLSVFCTKSFFAALKSSTEGHVLYTAKELTSTQSMLQENLANVGGNGNETGNIKPLSRNSRFPIGALVVADSQVGGRGRGGNQWTSPKGCLMFSFVTEHTKGTTLPFLQYVATMAAVDAIQECADKSIENAVSAYSEKNKNSNPIKFRKGTGHAVDVKIKWPNDLYSAGLKIGGVLCASTYVDGKFDVVIGVGLNLDNEAPTTCVNKIIDAKWRMLLEDAMGNETGDTGDKETPSDTVSITPTSREQLTASFMNRFEALSGLLNSTDSFDNLEPNYLRQWLHTDQSVILEENDGKVKTSVIVRGLTKSGYLLASGSNGQRYELHPDGNSFDFFKGLVRKKLLN